MIRFRRPLTACRWLGSLAWIAAAITAHVATAQTIQLAVPHPGWNQALDLQEGWCGGDGGGTVLLPGDRVLWMFGDSLIGHLEGDRLAAGSTMVNNAIGISGRKLADAPSPAHFRFQWGPQQQDKPTAWLTPETGTVTPGSQPDASGKPTSWYWPAGGGCVVPHGEGNRLVVFLFHVGSTGKPGVWGFQSVGGAMAVIDHPERPADQWKARQIDLPHTIDATLVDEHHEDVRRRYATEWGLSCLVEPAGTDPAQAEPGSNPWVLIYGTRIKQQPTRELLLARVRADQVDQPSQWRFYAGPNRWSNKLEEAVALTEGMPSEFSVSRIEHQGTSRYVMVHSQPWLGPQIYVRMAANPQGPWTTQIEVYEVPDVKKSKNFFTYAGRGHAALSRPGTLLITYAVNSQDFWEMLRNAVIYRPHAIELSLDPLWQVELPADSGNAGRSR